MLEFVVAFLSAEGREGFGDREVRGAGSDVKRWCDNPACEGGGPWPPLPRSVRAPCDGLLHGRGPIFCLAKACWRAWQSVAVAVG